MRCAFRLLLFALAWAALGSLLSAQSAPASEAWIVETIERPTEH